MIFLWLLFAPLADEGIQRQYRAHVRFLASDALAGRETTYPGQHLAAAYLAAQFELLGLDPVSRESPTPYFQRFELEVTDVEEDSIALALRGNGPRLSLRYERSFFIHPMGLGSTDVNGDMVFAGHGIQTDFYDDFGDVDVKGRWVLYLEGKPGFRNSVERQTRMDSYQISAYNKYLRAMGKGALGVVCLCRDPKKFPPRGVGARRDMAPPGDQDWEDEAVFPVLRVYPDQWPAFFGGEYRRFQKALETIETKAIPQSFVLRRRSLALRMTIARKRGWTENVMAVLPGQDAQLKHEYIAVSAHFDHIGVVDGQVFNGADDNASGTATLLLLAQHLQSKTRRRSLLILAFSGEEQGLLGSRYLVENPVIPLDRIVADINMDMIGRNGKHRLAVVPSKTKGLSSLKAILTSVNASGGHQFQLLDTYDRYHARSDHYNFIEKGIPALFLFAGVHQHYHSPLDDWERLDYEKLCRVYRLIEDFVLELLNQDARPRFIETEEGVAPSSEAN